MVQTEEQYVFIHKVCCGGFRDCGDCNWGEGVVVVVIGGEGVVVVVIGVRELWW